MSNLIFFSLAAGFDLAVDWASLIICNAGSGFVGLLIGFSQELRDRGMFLQGRALQLKHEAVAGMAKELEKLSRTDALTGLMNRRHLEETLARGWAACRRDGSHVGPLFIDVDHFKGYNDRYGHPAGDACLAQVGQPLSSSLSRASDVVARYCGEEFVVVLPRTQAADVAQIAEKIRVQVNALAIPHEASSCSNAVSVSIGAAAQVPDAGIDASDLLKRADMALYKAKRAGRHRVVFDPGSIATML